MRSFTDDGVTEELVVIDDVRGARISAVVAYPAIPRCLCVLASPHPHMGGTMNNKLVTHLARGLANTAATVRFDYSSVTARDSGTIQELVAASMDQFWTTGAAPEDPAMIADAGSVVAWAKRLGDFPLVVIGYSFGAFVAAKIASSHGAAAIIYIAPTLTRHDFSSVAVHAIPKLAIFSDNDFATPAEVTRQWVDKLPSPKLAYGVPAADHFYRGQEDKVLDGCHAFIDTAVLERGCPQEQQDDVHRLTHGVA